MALETKTSEEKDHAEFSASGSERWLNCPGSIALSESAPEQKESPYAAEGTKAHACLEFLLKNRANAAAALKTAKKNAEWNAEMIGHALDAIAWIEERHAAMPGAVLLSETKVDSSPFTCADQFGTLDVSIAHEFGRLIIIDYKYGAGVARSPEGDDGKGDSQLVYYALGISHQYHHNFSEVELVIIQPRAYHPSGEKYRSHLMGMNTLLAWEDVFLKGVKEAQKPKAPFKSGSWCRWCAAATICPQLKNKAMKDAQIVFSDLGGIESVPEPKSIQIPNLSVMLQAADRLEDWISKVREHAVHVLERGEKVPGFKLVAKKSPRRWTNADRISVEAKKEFGALAFSEPELLSPAQLEKAAKGRKDLDKWVEARTTNESSGTTLVAESDKRPAITPVQEVFAVPALPLKATFAPGRTFPVAIQGKTVSKKS